LTPRIGVDTIPVASLYGRKAIYAVVETGGKQYKVSPGDTINVDKLHVEGDTVELDKVYLVADGPKVTLGKPIVAGAKVVATVVGDGKKDKVIVFKYKPKTRYRRKKGHCQPYTSLAIKEIVLAKGRRAKKDGS
jgi:large subunit ribosomal protein L21